MILTILCTIFGLMNGFVLWVFFPTQIEKNWMPLQTYLKYQKIVFFIATLVILPTIIYLTFLK